MVETMVNFQELKNKVKQDRASKDVLESKYKDLLILKESLELTLTEAEQAREVIQTVAQKTLQNLEFRISNLGTLALKSVSPDFPELIARISMRRNQTEVDFLFKEFDVEQKPLESSGYGAVNIACYALRVSFWSLDKNRPVMILDEPFRDLSPDLQEKASDMIKMVSEKFDLQHVLVSHAEDLNYAADRTFVVEKIGKRSRVTVT